MSGSAAVKPRSILMPLRRRSAVARRSRRVRRNAYPPGRFRPPVDHEAARDTAGTYPRSPAIARRRGGTRHSPFDLARRTPPSERPGDRTERTLPSRVRTLTAPFPIRDRPVEHFSSAVRVQGRCRATRRGLQVPHPGRSCRGVARLRSGGCHPPVPYPACTAFPSATHVPRSNRSRITSNVPFDADIRPPSRSVAWLADDVLSLCRHRVGPRCRRRPSPLLLTGTHQNVKPRVHLLFTP
jgi:hypothetical protein